MAFKLIPHSSGWKGLFALAACSMLSAAALAQPQGDAKAMLKAMTGYIGAQQTIQVSSERSCNSVSTHWNMQRSRTVSRR